MWMSWKDTCGRRSVLTEYNPLRLDARGLFSSALMRAGPYGRLFRAMNTG